MVANCLVPYAGVYKGPITSFKRTWRPSPIPALVPGQTNTYTTTTFILRRYVIWNSHFKQRTFALYFCSIFPRLRERAPMHVQATRHHVSIFKLAFYRFTSREYTKQHRCCHQSIWYTTTTNRIKPNERADNTNGRAHSPIKTYSLPKFAQWLAQLGVLQMGILLGHDTSGRLRPHHKRVHWPLDVVLFTIRRRPIDARVSSVSDRGRENGHKQSLISGCSFFLFVKEIFLFWLCRWRQSVCN